ncbi:MAG: response regulator [Myxococcaceae bacterium]|nr:response regulator [Myxococcaceae bacterium]
MAPRVLVIDDSEILLNLTVNALNAAGYDAVGAVDLASLDAALAQSPVQLVLVDVNMPEMFGDDVVEFLRSQRKLDARLLLYSDLSEEELAQRAKTSGADGYIVKGAGIEAAVAEVRAQLGGGTRPPPAPAEPAPLPEPAPAKSPAEPAAAAVSQGPRKKRVLIVDDSEMVGHVLQGELTARGFDVFVADSAEKATRIILKKQTRPDLVLLDVRMPNVNGEQFCRFIKGNPLFSGIKVLLCSSESPEELRRICREAGADGFVGKEAVLARVISTDLG